MCDVCDTTLFNTHWVCHRCGFVVCIDCYRVKRKIHTKNSNNVCEENRRWLACTTNKNHEAEKLMLTSIIPADALKIARDLIHHVRRKHNIKSDCLCAPDRPDSADSSTPTANGVGNEVRIHVCLSYMLASTQISPCLTIRYLHGNLPLSRYITLRLFAEYTRQNDITSCYQWSKRNVCR